MDDVIELLQQLVAIDSVNSSLVKGAAGEAGIARFVAGWARGEGLGVEVLDDNVIVRSGGSSSDGRKLLLCGHLDTVGTGGMADPLVPRIDGDRLYGRGAYDMKGGLAAALIACRDAARRGVKGEVIVAAVADEEYGSEGVQRILPHVEADAAIVNEPTELTVATAHKGFIWTEITITGKAAHGSRPHLGVDAILKAGPVLLALDELDQQMRTRTHPLLGSGNLHGSLISGGREESTIPDRCVITVERRYLPGDTLLALERAIEDLLAECRDADSELEVSAKTTFVRRPLETPHDTEVLPVLMAAAKDVTGARPKIAGASYWADSAFISAAGIPTVLYGPGGEGAHADVEWVSIAETVACARTLTETAVNFCG
ncbi:M20/M25/M40 family metallo-hydrolase [Actinocrispum sp. NPDC049592]|uniref:M20/M25/M40 family metallo-hydrolase n=1 Tax=Actinocrispum sp. NPDC049592 TaxID=3154835 RepID=UPI0034223171